ncbi:MAG TPA: lysylphosphatidylglycerol synthase transmembrane domain-containing protein [Candidatus Limnocylindrales bacterium]|nr:lysylphosphatidylglycerol synthase transmembrane domain-containing protein [Candidatus Limnocylindrales bacterium]
MSAITPALNERAHGGTETGTPGGGRAPEREVSADQLSLVKRLRQPRTIVSLVLPIVLLALFVRSLPGFKLDELPGKVLAANPLLLLAAFLVFYLGFPLRGYRWARLVRATGFALPVPAATEIIFVSWLVNCLVPAKLGDIYRAYLLKINSPVSLSRTFGTVFIERILDLFAIVVLGLAAGFVSFRTGLPGDVQAVFAIGIGFVVLLAVGLLTLRNFGRRILVRLPIPHTILELYDRFEEGVFSVGLRSMPVLVVATGLIWSTEAIRLLFVVEALHLPGVHLGVSGAFFVALTGSLLTAVPLTPAGIGIVETGVVAVLTLVYGIPQTDALTITLVDRAISVLSIIVLGSVAYAISPLRRARGIEPAHGARSPA